MKKFVLFNLLLTLAFTASAQQYMRIWQGGNDTRVELKDIIYSNNGKTITVNGQNYSTATIDSITMVHIITVSYDGGKATVDIGKAPGVTYTANGADVAITSTNTKQELELVLQGNSTNGSLTYTGGYKCKFYLNGLNLTSTTGAALDIQCGKRVDLILCDGTKNSLADAANGTQKAALYCKGHLEVEGGGSLTVTGNARHAIATKEYLQLKKSTGNITVNKAVSDAIHAGQYFLMSGGNITISGQGSDGIQVDPVLLADDVTYDPEKENNGMAYVRGGSINITVNADDTKGFKVPKDLYVTGGTFTINANGKGSRGISVSGNMTINEDTNKTEMIIYAKGGLYTNADDEDSRCMGIKVVGNLTISAGKVAVYNTGTKSRGIKVSGTYTKTGTAIVQASITNK